ncbi:MAG: hypothetical protein M0R47_15895 [Methylobacter sp.]|uniref:hypothetical protein n=1 Tax=Methylobacter sp. TaxID=2051955 RepID=UPI0025DAE6CB|nr:hypothetical protein [Methylobacter sp.]MCK9622003.1 hypothetical protein [Methylobacter sp.]
MIIKALKRIVVPAGTRLVLSQEQHEARQHSLFSGWPGSALVTKDIEFKAGETLEVYGEMSRSVPVGDYVVIESDEPEPELEQEKPRKAKALKEAGEL